jgi:hypothetical protein
MKHSTPCSCFILFLRNFIFSPSPCTNITFLAIGEVSFRPTCH